MNRKLEMEPKKPESPWKRLEEFITEVRRTLEEKPSESFRRTLTPDEVFFTQGDLGGLMLSQESSTEYRRCIRAIHESVGGEHGRISQGAVADAVQIATMKALDAYKQDSEPDFSKRVHREVEELRRTLRREPDVYIVQLEVCGLDPKDLPRVVGNVNFYVSDENSFPGLPSLPPEQQNDETTKTRQENARVLRERVITSIKGKTYAALEIEAFDPKAARELAEKELQITLDVLNFFAELFSHEGARVFLPGDAAPSRNVAILSKKNEPRKNFYSFSDRRALLLFSFPPRDRDSPSLAAFERASSLLRERHGNRWNAKILSALRWSGRASVEERKEEALLLFCISLEALLLSNEDREIAYSFALRGAHLLVTEGTKRKEVFRDLKDLYTARSKIVHSGKAEVLSIELAKAEVLAKTALFIVLTTPPIFGICGRKGV
jgi:Apea-like HEPN